MIEGGGDSYPLLYTSQPGHIATALIGSHAHGYADPYSDYDLICLWRDDKWSFAPSENISIVETVWRDTDVQTVFYKHDWISALVAYFSRGGDIDGDWGELGFEAYLAFLQYAQFLAGSQAALEGIQQLLSYPETFRRKVQLKQLSRMLNSLRQFFHSRGRSPALFLKCRYDFLDSILRIEYARAGLFYSTIKWYSQDLHRFGVADSFCTSLENVINRPDCEVIDNCVAAAAATIGRLDNDIATEITTQILQCVQDGEKRGFKVESLRVLLS